MNDFYDDIINLEDRVTALEEIIKELLQKISILEKREKRMK